MFKKIRLSGLVGAAMVCLSTAGFAASADVHHGVDHAVVIGAGTRLAAAESDAGLPAKPSHAEVSDRIGAGSEATAGQSPDTFQPKAYLLLLTALGAVAFMSRRVRR